jgi:hypothetical protein
MPEEPDDAGPTKPVSMRIPRTDLVKLDALAADFVAEFGGAWDRTKVVRRLIHAAFTARAKKKKGRKV